MNNPDPTQASETRRQSGAIGCNVIGLIILLIAVAVFVVAAWVSNPEQAPEPSKTGVPPTAPAGVNP